MIDETAVIPRQVWDNLKPIPFELEPLTETESAVIACKMMAETGITLKKKKRRLVMHVTDDGHTITDYYGRTFKQRS